MTDRRNVREQPQAWNWADMPRAQPCEWPNCGAKVAPDNGACCHTLLPEDVADAIRMELRERQLGEFGGQTR